MLHRLIKGIAPVFAMAAAFAATGCDGNITVNGTKGVPLSELDLTGTPPTGIILAGPDSVVVTTGDTLAIDVTGDPAAVGFWRHQLQRLGAQADHRPTANGFLACVVEIGVHLIDGVSLAILLKQCGE